jgi:hypothetical protein
LGVALILLRVISVYRRLGQVLVSRFHVVKSLRLGYIMRLRLWKWSDGLLLGREAYVTKAYGRWYQDRPIAADIVNVTAATAAASNLGGPALKRSVQSSMSENGLGPLARANMSCPVVLPMVRMENQMQARYCLFHTGMSWEDFGARWGMGMDMNQGRGHL